MIHPDTELKVVSKEIGLGVFATKDIPAGTIIYVKDDLEVLITPELFLNLPEVLKEKTERYSYREANGVRVLSWDSAKFINHSCDANALSTGYGFEIAVRDIAAGEEITDDYGMFNITEDIELYCNCKNCRKVLRAEDFETYVPYWDTKVKNALSLLRKAEQPLLNLVSEPVQFSLFDYLDSGQNYTSVTALLFKPNGDSLQVHSDFLHSHELNGTNVSTVNGSTNGTRNGTKTGFRLKRVAANGSR